MPEGHPWADAMPGLRAEVLAVLEDPSAREDPALEGRLKARLEAAKDEYVAAYQDLLRRARLDLDGDRRKAEVLAGPRVRALEAVRSIDILPAGQLDQVKGALAALKATSTPSPDDLQHQPTFEGFRPARDSGAPASARLDALDDQLDRMVDGWTLTLIEALDRPETQAQLDLLAPDARGRVDAFREAGALPEPVEPALVAALREALSDLKGVRVRREALVEALFEGGAPATPSQLRERLDAFLSGVANGTSADRVRVLLEG